MHVGWMHAWWPTAVLNCSLCAGRGRGRLQTSIDGRDRASRRRTNNDAKAGWFSLALDNFSVFFCLVEGSIGRCALPMRLDGSGVRMRNICVNVQWQLLGHLF